MCSPVPTSLQQVLHTHHNRNVDCSECVSVWSDRQLPLKLICLHLSVRHCVVVIRLYLYLVHNFPVRIWPLLGERRSGSKRCFVWIRQVEHIELEMDGNCRVAPHGVQLCTIVQDDVLQKQSTTELLTLAQRMVTSI